MYVRGGGGTREQTFCTQTGVAHHKSRCIRRRRRRSVCVCAPFDFPPVRHAVSGGELGIAAGVRGVIVVSPARASSGPGGAGPSEGGGRPEINGLVTRVRARAYYTTDATCAMVVVVR